MRSIFRPNPYLFVSLGSALLAAAMWVLVPYQVDEPVSLFGFGPQGLDPKFFPYLVTAVWFFVSLWNVGEAVRQGADSQILGAAGITSSVIATLFMAFVYAWTLEMAGFVISSAAVVSLLTVYFGARDVLRIAFCALAVPGIVFLVFTRLLHVSLPPVPGSLLGGG